MAISQQFALASSDIPEKINRLLRTRQYAAALSELEALARQDHIGALKQLGKLYRSGRVVDKDWEKAIEYLARAAELGDAESQYFLGKLLIDGARSEQEFRRGLTWLKRGADQNQPQARKLYRENLHKVFSASPKNAQKLNDHPTGRMEQPGDYLAALAEQGDFERLKAAIKGGRNINARDQHGRTALAAAVQANQINVTKLLLQNGADPNALLPGGNTPLLIAIKDNHNDLAKLLLGAGADVNVKDDSGNTALIYTTERGSLDIVSALIIRGADVNAVDADGWSVMDVAQSKDNHAIKDLLASKGAKLRLEAKANEAKIIRATSDRRRNQGNNQLIYTAIAQSNHQLLTRLLTKDVDLRQRDRSGLTLLGRAVQSGDLFSVSLILRQGAAINLRDAHGRTPVHYAIDTDSSDRLEMLLKDGRVDADESWGDYPLHYSVRTGHIALLKTLLRYKFDPTTTDKYGQDAFELAAQIGAVSALIAFDATEHHLKERKAGRKTLLRHAVQGNQYAAAEYLIKQGSAKNLSNKTLGELLVASAGRANPLILQLLLDAGAAVDSSNAEGTTALMAATAAGCEECIEIAVSRGAHLNQQDRQGNTALHVAVLNKKSKIASKLIEFGADKDVVNRAGESYASITTFTK